MRKSIKSTSILAFAIAALIAQNAFAATSTQGFETMGSGGYGDYEVDAWSVSDGLKETGNVNSGSAACRLDRSPSAGQYIKSPEFAGGINSVEFYYRHWDGDDNLLTYYVQKSENGSDWVTVGTISNFNSTEFNFFQVDVNDENAKYIRVYHAQGSERMIFDDFAIDYNEAQLYPTVVESIDFEDGTLGDWTTYSVSGNYSWRADSYSGDRFASMSGYNDNEDSDDWLISPSLDLSDFSQATLSFRTAKGYSGDDITIWISTNYDPEVDDDPRNSDWTQLSAPLANSWTWVASGDVDITSFIGENVHVAYHYTGEPSYSAKWEVDDVVITGWSTSSQQGPELIGIETEDFEDGTLGDWTAVSVSGSNEWEPGSYREDNFAQMSGYRDDADSEDWLVSPAMNLMPYTNIKFRFRTAKGYSGDDIVVKVSMNYDPEIHENPNDARWYDLEADLASSWTWVASGDLDLTRFRGANVHVAFRYVGEPYYSAQWEVDDIVIEGEEIERETIFSDDFEDGSSLYPWETYSVKSDENWERGSYSGDWFAQINGYGADEESDDWLISPPLNLAAYSDVIFNFNTAKGYSGPNIKVWVSTDYISGQNPHYYNWTLLDAALANSWDWVASGDIDLSAFNGTNVRVAFQYTTTGTYGGDAAKWEVDDVLVSGMPGNTMYPAPFKLSDGDFQFDSWSPGAEGGTYPAHMAFRQTSESDPGTDNPMNGFWRCAYDLTSKSRINGLGDEGIAFQNTSQAQDDCENAGYLGAADLALNTKGKCNVQVDFDAEFINELTGDTDREYRLKLQYRADQTDFADVLGEDGNLVEFDYNAYASDYAAPDYEENFSVMLPYDAEDKELVELRWKYYMHSGSAGARPKIRLDNIAVSAEDGVGEPVKLLISKVDPSSPLKGIPFSITVQAVDENNVPMRVGEDTEIRLSLKSGSGIFFGDLTGTISERERSVVFENLTYDKIQTITVRAEVVSGHELPAADKRIDVVEGPVELAFVDFYPKGFVNIPLPEFKVEARNEDGAVNENYHNYNVTLSVVNGNGSMVGTVEKTIQNGVVSFDDIAFDAEDANYMITATAPGLGDNEKPLVDINRIPNMTEVAVPQYIIGAKTYEDENGGRTSVANFGERMPSYALVKLDNLHPNTTYRFTSGGREVGYKQDDPNFDPQKDDGAGNNLFYNCETGERIYYSYKSKNMDGYSDSEGYYSSFKTGENETEKYVWMSLVPTANSAFSVPDGKEVYWIFSLGTERGTVVRRYNTTNTSKPLLFQDTDMPDDVISNNPEFDASDFRNYATGLYDSDSWIQPGKYVAVYADPEANAMPLTTAIVQDDGATVTTPGFPHQAPEYFATRDDAEGAWATFLPNEQKDGNYTSVQRLEQYDLDGALERVWTDADGIWAGVNTNDPTGGKNTPIEIKTPQLFLDAPSDEGEICNYDVYDVKFRARGVEKINLEVIQEETSAIKVFEELPVKEGAQTYDWEVIRGVYNDIPSRFVARSMDDPDFHLTSSSASFLIYDAPRIYSSSESFVACKGDDAQLWVIADGSDLHYQWFKDGLPIKDATGTQLELENMDFSTSGEYICVVLGGLVSGNLVCEPVATDPIVVYIAQETKITRQPADQPFLDGSTAMFKFDAHVNGIPEDYDINIQWYKVGGDALIDDSRFAGTKSNILTVRNLSTDDRDDQYYAVIEGLCNNAPVATDAAGYFDIEGVVEHEVKQYAACEGDTKVLRAMSEPAGYGMLTFQWYKDGVELTDGGNISGSKMRNLKIDDVSDSDLGTYSFRATLHLEAYNNEYSIEIPGEPSTILAFSAKPRVETQPADVAVNEDESFSIFVETTGGEPMSYRWYKDRKPLMIGSSATYAVDFAKEEHVGEYYCVVFNECGEAKSETAIVDVTTGMVNDVEENAVAGAYFLSNPTPNPARNAAQISFAAPESAEVKIVLTSIYGKEIATVFEQTVGAGAYDVSIDVEKLELVSGVYYYTLLSKNASITRKLVIVK